MYKFQIENYKSLVWMLKLLHTLLMAACESLKIIANEAADPRGSAVELANHRAVREYRRKISSQRKGLFLTIFGCK